MKLATVTLAALAALSCLACSDSDSYTGPPCEARAWVVTGAAFTRDCDGALVAEVCAVDHPGAFVEVALAGPRYSIAYRSDGVAWVRHGNPSETLDCLRAEDLEAGDVVSIEN